MEQTAGEVSSLIRDHLLSLPLAGGERIFETHLARAAGFSRPVVREACRILADEGLLTYTVNRGYSLRLMTAKEVRELVEFRLILEDAAFTAAASRTDRVRICDRLRSAYEDIKRIGNVEDPVRQISADLAFHRVAIEEMDNDWVSQSFDRMSTQLLYLMRLLNRSLSDFKIYGPSHESLIAACESGDLERTRSTIRRHIEIFLPTLLERVAPGE